MTSSSSSDNGIEALDLGNVESKKILSLLECPVCYDYITPPIKQCIKGHLVCSSCYQKLTNCPTCREELSTGSENSGIGRVDFRVSGSSGNENFGCFSGNCKSFSGTRNYMHFTSKMAE